MPLSNHTLLKYLLLIDVDTIFITNAAKAEPRRDYPAINQMVVIECESVSIEYINGGIGIGVSYWIDNYPVYREYTGRYDFIQYDVRDYSIEDWKREQALGLHRPT